MSAVTAVAAAQVGETLTMLLLGALAAAQKYAQIKAAAEAQGREVNLDDLKAARAESDTAAAELDAAISAHGG